MSKQYRVTEGDRFLIYCLFFASTFMVQIVFMNMLIAIMGDTFDRTTENQESNATKTKMELLNDYIICINRDNIDGPQISDGDSEPDTEQSVFK